MTKPNLKTFRQVLHLTVPIENDNAFNQSWKSGDNRGVGEPIWYAETGAYIVPDSEDSRTRWNKFLTEIGLPPHMEVFQGRQQEEYEKKCLDTTWNQEQVEFSIRSGQYFDEEPAIPTVTPQTYSKEAFFGLVPEFEKVLTSVISTMDEHNLDVGGCILDDGLIPPGMMLPGAGIPMFVLPPAFEEHLDQLAAARFQTMVYESLDLKNRFSIDYIFSQISSTESITFAMQSYENCAFVNRQFAGQNLYNQRIVLSAGDKIILGGCWLNDADTAAGQCAGMSAQSYIEYSAEKLDEARQAAIAAGSPTPWYGKIYDKGNGHRFALVPILTEKKRNLVKKTDDCSTLPALKHWSGEMRDLLASTKIVSRVFTTEELEGLYPKLAPVCEALREELDTLGIDMGARVVEADLMPFGPSSQGHRALLCVLPDKFEPALLAIASALPYPATLDLRAGARVATEEFRFASPDGREYSFHIELDDIRAAMTGENFTCYGRIAYCAGDSVAVTEFSRPAQIDLLATGLVNQINEVSQKLKKEYFSGGAWRASHITHMPWFGSATKLSGDGKTEVALIPVLDNYRVSEWG